MAAATNVSNTSRGVWSNLESDYELQETIGYGATAVVIAALYKVTGEKVAIKRIDLEKCGADIDEMRKEIQTMSRCNHENVVNYYTSFIVKQELWIVMKLLDGGSVLDIIKQLIKNGQVDPVQGVLDEIVVATILREVLKGLEYFHKNGQIHRDVKAGNILLGGDGSVQLADFGVSSTVVEYTDRGQKLRNTFVGTPCWMAPEVMEQTGGYNYKVDIWSFGITAIELATGTAPYAQFPAMKVLMLTLEGEPPTLETCSNGEREAYKKYSKQFRKMIASCLQKEPAMRPDATELLKNQFFKKAKSKEYLIPNLIELAPKVHERGKKPRQKPQSMDGSKDHADDWEFGSGTEDDSSEEPSAESKEPIANKPAAPAETPQTAPPKEVEDKQPEPTKTEATPSETPPTIATPAVATPAVATPAAATPAAATDASDAVKVYDLTLRLRNGSKELNDIRFEFNTKNDSIEGVSQELMSAGLIDGKDLLIVGANLSKMLTNPPESKSLTFSLKSDETNLERDEKNLIGYAMLTLNN